MKMKILLFCLVVMTMMAASETAYAQPRTDLWKTQSGGECTLTEDELDETLGGLEEFGLLV